MNLDELGWCPHFAGQLAAAADAGLVPARVYRQDVNRYLVLTEDGECAAILPRRARNQAQSRAELPAVGDWVLLDPASDPSVIAHVFTRFSRFSRREAGDVVGEQVVAANIDTVFIVSGLDHNFNARRIERYLVLCQNSGADPVIVLNKADLCEQVEACITELASIAAGAPIHVLSALDPASVAQLRAYLGPGRTAALLGSSGVGKSTIINALIGESTQQTSDVRDGDSKGRHTTTHRELFLLPGGGLIIDTPGMREVQLWTDEASIDDSFADVVTFAGACRFSDCRHGAEPGCAVRAAIDTGALDGARLDSYQKYHRELSHLDEKIDPAMRAEKRKARRRFSKLLRKRPDKRD